MISHSKSVDVPKFQTEPSLFKPKNWDKSETKYKTF